MLANHNGVSVCQEFEMMWSETMYITRTVRTEKQDGRLDITMDARSDADGEDMCQLFGWGFDSWCYEDVRCWLHLLPYYYIRC